MIRKTILFLFLAFLTSACSIYHIDSQETSVDYYPSKKSASDVIYLPEVKQAHEMIGVVTVNTERNQKIEEVIEKMKYEAAVLGADAITDVKSDATGTWKKLPAQDLLKNAYVRANFNASAIVFKKAK